MPSHLTRMLATAGYVAAVSTSPSNAHHPDLTAAEDNSFALFNSIHAAMRQFGSSVHHNGLSFYLAQAPEGSIFYHGDHSISTPPGFEWLAFEFEHAQIFAESWEPREVSHPGSYDTDLLPWHRVSRRLPLASKDADILQAQASVQHPLFVVSSANDNDNLRGLAGPHSPDWSKPIRGYFHTYVANRPLNLLYIGGESAAKCDLGPMDSQDFILLNQSHDGRANSSRGEMARATDLCALANEWRFEAGGRLDGFVRMEAGFEIIYCNFFDGLDLLSVQASPFRNETGIDFDQSFSSGRSPSAQIPGFEWLRAVAARFHGHPAGRLDVDWSSMVSALSYPVNLSNPDSNRPDLPRVINTKPEERRNIRARLREVVVKRGGRNIAEKGVVNWQSVVDRIVTRFSKRLWWMGSTDLGRGDLIPGIGTLINPFIDYLDHSPMAKKLAVDRCTQHYIDALNWHPDSWTPEDRAIAAAVGAVSRTICTSLFSAREVLLYNTTTAAIESSADMARGIIQKLISDLRWSTWKECHSCGPDEICSIPMYPVGSEEDYFHPKCKNATGMLSSRGYWKF